VRTTIADNGIGIAPEQQAKLFEPFARLGAEQTQVEGTGLGLALSKGLLEAMGGRSRSLHGRAQEPRSRSSWPAPRDQPASASPRTIASGPSSTTRQANAR
jgi:hypothetical protein